MHSFEVWEIIDDDDCGYFKSDTIMDLILYLERLMWDGKRRNQYNLAFQQF